jgi:hypothetical protein
VPLQTTAPSVVHVVKLPAAALDADEDEDGEPVGEAAEAPDEGPGTP